MKNSVLLLSVALVMPISLYAQTDTQTNQGLPDNPGLLRVLVYKTGQTISRTGNAIQRTADRTGQSIQVAGESAGQHIDQGATRVTTFTREKLQQGKEMVTGSSDGQNPVPIQQGNLSKPENPSYTQMNGTATTAPQIINPN
ncbi:hypothetical protein F4V57_08405 [Acinetobacter qingfengensis]|uniref:hypothetical protein n=1 Tax=Acinetobacter qingfengensis TaxID=1262585 RepID=UPI00114CAAF1|nr:hypothetical protein [Acinetobacter qingfengensis]KAA8733237.1 hypothetical protein F4V57_08405 [Acinetobacter qingfengensis]